MKITLTLPKTLLAIGLVTLVSAQAQTLTSTWTYAGGGLNPATYGGNFQPDVLNPDTGSTSGGSIAMSGFTSGGLGSSGYPDGYGGIYTFFSDNTSYVLSTTTILGGVDEVTISLWAGGGFPALIAYTATSLHLDYNGGSQQLVSSSFDNSVTQEVSTPLGLQTLTLYTWTWTGISDLGALTSLSTQWDTQGNQHVFMTDISLTQAIPEPSTLALLLAGGTLFALRRKRKH